VDDLAPLAGLPLTYFEARQCDHIKDLSPLAKLKLNYLNLAKTQVCDLSPIAGMPLTALNLSECKELSDLKPLKGLPLQSLNLSECKQVTDLSPLEGMNLQELIFAPESATEGLQAIREMKSLKAIGTSWQADKKWPPEEFWRLYDAGQFKELDKPAKPPAGT
jgi:internalin A